MTAFEIPGRNYLGETLIDPTVATTSAGLTLGESLVRGKASVRQISDLGLVTGGLPNPDFEVNANFWYQGTLDTAPTRSTTESRTGAASLKVTG
jgi:hypothetical protein